MFVQEFRFEISFFKVLGEGMGLVQGGEGVWGLSWVLGFCIWNLVISLVFYVVERLRDESFFLSFFGIG